MRWVLRDCDVKFLSDFYCMLQITATRQGEPEKKKNKAGLIKLNEIHINNVNANLGVN